MKKTPLYENHVALGASMVDFAGYLMPVRYRGEKSEHFAVRTAAGLFDVSHMGEIFLLGKKAVEASDFLFTNHVAAAADGQALYGAMLNEQGGIVDDVVVYKFSDEKVLFCVNAANRDKDFSWMKTLVSSRFSEDEVQVVDESDSFAQLAIQGPLAEKILQGFLDFDLNKLKKFRFAEAKIFRNDCWTNAIIARTGYTGEDGFEVFLGNNDAPWFWQALIEEGENQGLLPCGLSARDTLRLEAGMCLYGNDISDSTSPLEAGIGWTVKWGKPTAFFGEKRLFAQKEKGISRKLVGLRLPDRNIARSGYAIYDEKDNVVGHITSGTMSSTLQFPIALGYLEKAFAEIGTQVYVEIRKNKSLATVVKLPFYTRTEG